MMRATSLLAAILASGAGAGIASAQPVAMPNEAGASEAQSSPAESPAFNQLEQALPAGWTMLATGSELVLRHDRPCYATGVRHDNPPPQPLSTAPAAGAAPAAKPALAAGGNLVTVELRYHLEPRWTAKQLAAARTANDKVASDLRALGAKYHIDQIHHSKGKPLPANDDERARLAAYDSEHARIAKRLAPVPHCTLGEASVFDGEDTYAQLALELDPPDVIPQAYRILALMKQYCR